MVMLPPFGAAHTWLEQQGIKVGSSVEVVNELGERFTLTLGKYREGNRIYGVKGSKIKVISAYRLCQWVQRAQASTSSV